MTTRRWAEFGLERPRFAATGAAAAIAIALVFVPFSYERTAGHEVSLTVPGPLAEQAGHELAKSFENSLGMRGIRLTVNDAGSRFTARVRGRSGKELSSLARSFAQALHERDVAAEVDVVPVKETASGNVYALASTQMHEILVEVRGRSNAEIEQDIRSQLSAIGFSNPSVTLQRDGGNMELNISGEGNGGSADAKLQAKIVTVRQGDGAAGEEPPIHMQFLDTSDLKGLPDDQMKAAIEDRLRANGMEGTVSVENGEVKVELHKEVRK